MSRNYRLIVAPWKFDVLKTSMFALKASLLGQIFVLRTSNFLFGGRALWADSGPPWMNTIASREQFKPIIGENLVVNCN